MNDTQITGTVGRDVEWARHHLFLLAVVVILVIGSVYSIESLLANRSREFLIQQQTLLSQLQKQNERTQQQTKAQIDSLTQANLGLQQQLSTLAIAISTRDAELLKTRQAIKTLPPSQLATKWGAAAEEPAPGLDANDNFITPLSLAQKSVDALLQVPVLTQDNKDLTTQLDTEKQVAANNDAKFLNEQKSHISDNSVCKQTIATKDAEIKDVKAQARKRNILIAIFGAALGFGLHR